MSTNFPTSLDSFTNPAATDLLTGPGAVPHHSQHANLNDAVAALEAKVGIDGSAVTSSLDYKIANLLPAGVILMWSGSIATIPSGWALCDGTVGTPDLRDKFIVGATSDDAGVAKTNIEGSLKQTGGVTGHSHSAHANLTHAGASIADHTGLTHGLTISDHPDLTHAALSHAASTFSHPDHSIASANAALAAFTITHADHSIGSHTNISVPSHSHATTTASLASFNSGMLTTPTATSRAILRSSLAELSGVSFNSIAGASIAAATYTHADHSIAAKSATIAAITVTHADHSFPSLSHQAIGTHKGTDYGVHTFTAPAAHGSAGTLTHSFTEPNDHTISAHDTVLSLPNYYALAYIVKV